MGVNRAIGTMMKDYGIGTWVFLLNFTKRIPFHEKMIFLQERKKERGNQTCAPNTLALLNKRIENPHALLKIGAKSGFCAPGARSSQPLAITQISEGENWA